MTWNWRIIWLFKEAFSQGIVLTLELTILAVILGTILGVILAFGKKSTNSLINIPAKIYIELFRALPLLVLLIWIYYCFPLIGIKISAFNTALIALSINLSAFVAEVIRGSIGSVPKGQLESALSLGLSRVQAMRYIILPQAVRRMLPALIGFYITQLKLSSLASIIAVNEILHQANIIISNTFRPLEIYTTVAIIYIAIVLPIVYVGNLIEKKLGFKTRTI